MGDAVEQGRGHLGIAENPAPFREGQVGGDDQRCLFVELTDQMEQQGTRGARLESQSHQTLLELYQHRVARYAGEPAERQEIARNGSRFAHGSVAEWVSPDWRPWPTLQGTSRTACTAKLLLQSRLLVAMCFRRRPAFRSRSCLRTSPIATAGYGGTVRRKPLPPHRSYHAIVRRFATPLLGRRGRT